MNAGNIVFALFRSRAQADAAAAGLTAKGAAVVRLETPSTDPLRQLHEPQPTVWRISLSLKGLVALFLCLATICIPGVGYATAIIALITVIAVRPRETEHRLLVRDATLASGGALLQLEAGSLRSQHLIRLLQGYGAVDIHEHEEPQPSSKERS